MFESHDHSLQYGRDAFLLILPMMTAKICHPELVPVEYLLFVVLTDRKLDSA